MRLFEATNSILKNVNERRRKLKKCSQTHETYQRCDETEAGKTGDKRSNIIL